jgi:hypothetical protein
VQYKYFAHLTAFEVPSLGPEPVRIERRLLYGGDTSQQRTAARVVSWSGVQESDWGVPNLEGFRDGCLLCATRTPDWSYSASVD